MNSKDNSRRIISTNLLPEHVNLQLEQYKIRQKRQNYKRVLKHKYKELYKVLVDTNFECEVCYGWATIVHQIYKGTNAEGVQNFKVLAVCLNHSRELKKSSFANVLNNYKAESNFYTSLSDEDSELLCLTKASRYQDLIWYNKTIKMFEDRL